MKNYLLGLQLLVCSLPAISQTRLFSKTLSTQEVSPQLQIRQNDARHYLSTRYVKQSLLLAEQDYLISLREDWQVHSKFTKMHRHGAGSYSYEGVIEGPQPGHVVLSAYADRIAGMITFDDGRRFMIDQPADGIFAISQTSEAAFAQQEGLQDFVEVKQQGNAMQTLANADVCQINNTCPAPSVIDLMVVYTQAAENAWGGQANTVANISTAVTNMTASMTNSGISNVSFRLVQTAKVTYTESGNFSTDLSRLAGSSDGYMDEIHGWRDQYGADMVSLIIGSPTSSCGIGYLNTNPTNYSATNGFNVSLYSCVVGNYTMAHEFGHNMGLRHDYYVDGGTTPCAHHHGYVNQTAVQLGTASTSAQRWRTIMAYNNQCSDAGFNCTRLNRWSNPQLTYNGDPTGRPIGGTQPADEAYAFYRMACIVASFRPTATTCGTPGGLSTTNIGTNSATLNWNIVAGANNYDVEYKTSAATTWTVAATGTTTNSVTLNSLQAGTNYNWRVRANCTGESGNFATASFSTNAVCATPTTLSSNNITSSSATLTWAAVSGAVGYNVEIKTEAAANWNLLVSGITSTSTNATGLMAGTAYNWRVQATCTEGSSAWANANFTTQAAACTDPYESNNSRSTATAISTNTNIQALIGTSNDNDYFKFSNSSSAANIRITLTNLPGNYNLELYRTGVNKRVAASSNSGTINETITLNNAAIGQYEARVYGNNRNEYNAAQCYTLRAEISNTAFDDAGNDKTDWATISPGSITAYPVPAKDLLNIAFHSPENGLVSINLVNQMGVALRQQSMNANKGINFASMNVGNLSQGLYVLKLVQGKTIRTAKVLVIR